MLAALTVLALSSTPTVRAEEDGREIWVNGLRLDADQILLLEDFAGVRLRSGAYIYDPMTGGLRAIAMSDTAAPPLQYANADEARGDQR